jgi:twitching motility protein PilT
LSTLHTLDASETIGRMVELFPPGKQPQIVAILAGVLRGVISQRLMPRVGGGRVPAVEVMVSNARIADLIRDLRSEDIPEAIAEGEFYEMQTFLKALVNLVLAGLVDRETAANAASNRHDFEIALRHAEKAANVAGAKEAGLQKEPEPQVVERPKDDGRPTLRVAGA